MSHHFELRSPVGVFATRRPSGEIMDIQVHWLTDDNWSDVLEWVRTQSLGVVSHLHPEMTPPINGTHSMGARYSLYFERVEDAVLFKTFWSHVEGVVELPEGGA